ncbi:hypothetical protein ON010_g1136 [Phytophthora cinnamomi]|nr:hypothetical protein ON010_g1136 [Phytophthora cinnamomi]
MQVGPALLVGHHGEDGYSVQWARVELAVDAAYSDEEFGSEPEVDAGYEEFAEEDEETDEKQDGVEQGSPREPGEENVDGYDAEFDEDDPAVVVAGPPPIEVTGVPVESTPAGADDFAGDSQEDAEPYHGEFDEDSAVVDVEPPTEEKNVVASEPTPPAAEMTQNEDRIEKVSPDPDDQTGAVNDSEVEYSVDLEHEVAPAPPENTILSRNLGEEAVSPRRSSVPSPVIARMTNDFMPKARFVRAGSMPLMLSTAPRDKWMDSIPQELSPERQGRARKQSACFPVLEETPPQNLAEEETNTEEDENGVEDDNNDPVSNNAASSRARAQSYRDIHSDKVVVPARRTQSLFYAGSLPRVEEVHVLEEVADLPQSQERDDSYSEDNGSYGEASHDSFESDNENDEIQPTRVERPKNGPSTFMYEIPDIENTVGNHDIGPTGLNGEVDPDSPVVQTPDSAPTPEKPEPPRSSQNDDEYADEMEDEFPDDTEAPHFEREDSPPKSNDEPSDYDVDEFVEDGRRETETLLQEARTILELQRNENFQALASEQQNAPPESLAQAEGNGKEVTEEKREDTGDEAFATMYDDDDEFDTDTPRQATPEQDTCVGHDEVGQYELDTDKFETQDSVLPQNDTMVPVEIVDKIIDSEQPFDSEVPAKEVACTDNLPVKMENEAQPPTPPTEQLSLKAEAARVKVEALPSQPTEASVSTEAPLATVADDKEKTKAPKEPSQPGPGQSRPARPMKNASPAAKQPSPPMKPSRPATNRTTAPPPPSADNKPTTTPRPPRSKVKSSKLDLQASPTTPAVCNSPATENNPGETTVPSQSPRNQESPPKTSSKISSPRSPSKSSYQFLPNEYPQLPRKAPVPKQKVDSKPSTSGEHGGKRRLLQPVRTPANLRFDLPKMDKTKRDWLFVNMFRHGDDLSKYDAFVPPTLRARPPTSGNLKETKKRPLSARQVYGNPQTSRFVSPSRRIIQPPNPILQDRERNWVPTTPHDSKLPPYDSILDKYCTTVTSPVVQRQIYQTRHRDLSPQLAFVLEKRVEKHCRKGFYDSFGDVSSSYKTEIVPISPGDDRSRQRQTSPRSPTKSPIKSGMLTTSSDPAAAPEE